MSEMIKIEKIPPIYGDLAGAAVARGLTPPCVVFNRRDAKVSLSIPGTRKRKNEGEVGVEDKETGERHVAGSWGPMCPLLWATSLVGSVVACVRLPIR